MFLACSPLFGPLNVHSPSGHVAAATVVTEGLAIMLTRHRASIFPAALLTAVVIGISRLVLGMHSLPEVVVGALIRLAGAAALMRFAGRPPELKLAPLIGYCRDRGPVSRLASASGGCDPSHGIPRSPKHPGFPCDTGISTPSGNRAVLAACGTVLTELL
jgi:hypothetical protein